MQLHEYIEKAKAELDTMYLDYLEGNRKNPENWPLEAEEGEWGDQELAERFS